MADPLLDELLSDSRPVVEQLLTEAPWSIAQLRDYLGAYEIDLMAPSHDVADRETARSLLIACRKLLDLIGDAPDARTMLLTHVAVRYFVLEEDGDGDRDSPFGFDDDVEVFNAVAAQLGLESLLVG